LFLEIARRQCSGPQLARIKAFLQAEFGPMKAAEGNRPLLSSLIGEDCIILRLSCADLEDLIDVAATRLARAIQRPDASTLAARIWERECIASTAIGSGVAVPHALLPKIQPMAVLITLARPLAVETPDGAPLRMAVVCVAPESPRGPLELLAQVARLASQNCAESFCALRSPAEALAQLRQIEATSA
jgi:PTS system nitrogen regulatory IIA component